MASLTSAQRDGIVKRCSGLLATYFTTSTLRAVTLELHPAGPSAEELEFHDYLRLATLLPAGSELCDHLARISLAPAVEQETTIRLDRGRLGGPVDPVALARRAAQRSSPRLIPVRSVAAHHATPENVVAASAAAALVNELQRLIARTRLPVASTEATMAVRILDAAQAALANLPLVDVLDHVVDLDSYQMSERLEQVEERWRARRISNRAYADVSRWTTKNRRRYLASEGVLTGVSYGDDFDNRLFEIFTLACIRIGLEQLGYVCTTARPLHLAREHPAMEFTHPDAAPVLDVYFQRADGVVWTNVAPRSWSGISGIPDIVMVARSPSHPAILIDAKNRNRGPMNTDDGELVGRHSTSDELHKMLGYFTNFHRRCRIGQRGPVGGLVYASTTATSDVWTTKSDQHGLLATVAIAPTDARQLATASKAFIEPLLRAAGLLGGDRPDGWAADAQLQALHATQSAETGDDDREAVIDEIHAWTQEHYGADPTRMASAEHALEVHVLGDAWHLLLDEERRFLATAEVFWSDHAGAVTMDFGPVVIELAKVFESLANRTVIEPFREWASQSGREVGQVATIGDIRAELQRVAELAPGATKPKGARSLADYLDAAGRRAEAIGELLPVLKRLNPIRRDAAHPHRITSRSAAEARAWMLGVGPEPSALSRLATVLATVRP
jgi:hypothetical protein